MFKPFFISPAGVFDSPEALVRTLVMIRQETLQREIPPADYAGLAEKIVRCGARWQDQESGRIIDPCVHRETPTATARYAGALGALMLQGRCHDLAGSCRMAFEAVLSDLVSKATNHGEFLVKESLFAFMALEKYVDPDIYQRWSRLYAGYDPEITYSRTRSATPDAEMRQNFVTFALAGEAMKKHLGLGENDLFFNTSLAEQLERFDELGMYRDPGAPMVYDMTARMNLTLAEYFTAEDTPLIGRLREKLCSGAFCSLLYQSSTGEMPFGGRSNQQNFIEASFALICEREARRCKEENDLLLAGVFRRAAARAVHSIVPFLESDPVCFNKNRFPPETQHGRQKNYGYYGAYTLLIASQLALASFLADETIPFAAVTPAESGSFLWRTTDVFHKVFANVQGAHLEIEFCNDTGYDAVGWGRWHIKGVPSEMLLSTPVPREQKFISVFPETGSLAFGAGNAAGGFTSDLSIKDPSCCKLHDVIVRDEELSFVIDWPFAAGPVSEKITLLPEGIDVEAVDHAGENISYRVPAILTDGRSWSVTEKTENGFELFYKGFKLIVSGNGAEPVQEKRAGANRNGLYSSLRFDSPEHRIRISFSVEKEK